MCRFMGTYLILISGQVKSSKEKQQLMSKFLEWKKSEAFSGKLWVEATESAMSKSLPQDVGELVPHSRSLCLQGMQALFPQSVNLLMM